MALSPIKPAAVRRAVFTFWALFALAAVPAPALSQPSPYLEQLLAQAKQQRLHEERNWIVLLHYGKGMGGSYRSKINDPRFFLSADGRTDPEAELRATLAGFFEAGAKDGTQAGCRFPARLQWLKERLAIDVSQLPPFSCSERDSLIGQVDAHSAALIFPVGHINSPASMFGHTLIRIDSGSRSSLISFAVNYAAETTDVNGIVYAYKGLFGKYRGYYSLMPYYLKVKEYSDLEHRDIWEYRLKLSREEVNRMLLHVLELEYISSQYYFLDENCSYNLLFLIEAARPSLHLTDRTGVLVLPTNTIEIALESGILDEAAYRPSQGTRIRKIASTLDASGQQAALELAQDARQPVALRLSNTPLDTQREVLDLAAEMVQFRFAKKELDKESYSKLYLKLLTERSKLGTAPGEPYKIDPPPPPEAGHRTTKLAVGGGARRGEGYAELGLQPEFHGLLDPDQGYLKGAQIKFLDTAVDYYPAQEKAQLRTLHLLDIVSTAPRDLFFRPLSWKVNVGFDQEAMPDGEDHLIFRLNSGGGLSYHSPFGGIMYGFGEIDLNAGGGIRAGVTAGPGVSLGIMEQLTPWWKVQLQAQTFYYGIGDHRFSVKSQLAQNLRLSQNNSLSLEGSLQWVNGDRVPELRALWNHYF
ncbi:DUF4105 domain-containing protein [Geomonas sp.]|uniref:Lnb N-terminal periplasmic domain-containing protein n=1 Tax=Geomonas sp. TaxID=2651584 RepID=UPI002B47B6E7|nr:DUF4105 domain-containing protein [Geomonas sp.]HJV36988.1 DUF4105 domain-containing protein [Geomonas sp.]